MNKTTLESLEEALERLEQIDGMYSWAHLLYEVREALAEQEKQKPVAWMVIGDGQHGVYKAGEHFDSIECSSYWNNRGYELVPVYAAPVSAKREWVDLTDDEIDLIEQQVYCRTTQKGRPLGVYAVELVRAVITAFKEKNT